MNDILPKLMCHTKLTMFLNRGDHIESQRCHEDRTLPDDKRTSDKGKQGLRLGSLFTCVVLADQVTLSPAKRCSPFREQGGPPYHHFDT